MQQSFLELFGQKGETKFNVKRWVEEQSKDEMLKILKKVYNFNDVDITRERNIYTDSGGHIFTFPYDSRIVSFVNYLIYFYDKENTEANNIIKGKIYRKPSSDLEQKCFEDRYTILSSETYSIKEKEQFVREFDFRHFLLYYDLSGFGTETFKSQIRDVMREVMRIAEMPIEDVLVAYRHCLPNWTIRYAPSKKEVEVMAHKV